MDITLLNQIIKGLYLTISLAFFALFSGFLFTFILLYIKNSNLYNKYINLLINAFCFLIRGTPTLIQIFIIYYGLSELSIINNTFLWNAFQYPFFCAALALMINNCAYSYILFQGTINSIPKEQIFQAQLLGLSSFKIFIKIIFPQALKNVWGAYVNELIVIVKATSLASSITILELTGTMNKFAANTFQPLLAYGLCAICYYFINLAIIILFKKLIPRLF